MTTSLTTLESILAHPRELSPHNVEVIRETLPVIGAHIDEITHPELLRDTFNRGNQQLGAQQRALAASIATFATLLVDGRSPVDMLSRIGHKHASLGITPDQYQVVHDYLFAAIVEVLVHVFGAQGLPERGMDRETPQTGGVRVDGRGA